MRVMPMLCPSHASAKPRLIKLMRCQRNAGAHPTLCRFVTGIYATDPFSWISSAGGREDTSPEEVLFYPFIVTVTFAFRFRKFQLAYADKARKLNAFERKGRMPESKERERAKRSFFKRGTFSEPVQKKKKKVLRQKTEKLKTRD